MTWLDPRAILQRIYGQVLAVARHLSRRHAASRNKLERRVYPGAARLQPTPTLMPLVTSISCALPQGTRRKPSLPDAVTRSNPLSPSACMIGIRAAILTGTPSLCAPSSSTVMKPGPRKFPPKGRVGTAVAKAAAFKIKRLSLNPYRDRRPNAFNCA